MSDLFKVGIRQIFIIVTRFEVLNLNFNNFNDLLSAGIFC